MIQMAAGVAVCGVSVLYLSTVVAVMTGQRESDRLEIHGLIGDLRADLDALLDHLNLEITAGWPEQEPAPVDEPDSESPPGYVRAGMYWVPEEPLRFPDDAPTGPIPIVEPAPDTAPLERVWDEAAAELVAAERPPASDWVEQQLAEIRARGAQRPQRNRRKAKEDAA